MSIERGVADFALESGPLQRARLLLAGAELCADTPAGPRPVTQAVSCLVMPEAGDLALLCDAGGELYVLAILARSSGPLVLQPGKGNELAVQANVIRLQAVSRLEIDAPDTELKMERVLARIRVGTLVGETLGVAAAFLRSVASRAEQTVGEMICNAGSRLSVVRGTDTLHAGNTASKITGVAATQTAASVLTASSDVKIDAERISLA